MFSRIMIDNFMRNSTATITIHCINHPPPVIRVLINCALFLMLAILRTPINAMTEIKVNVV